MIFFQERAGGDSARDLVCSRPAATLCETKFFVTGNYMPVGLTAIYKSIFLFDLVTYKSAIIESSARNNTKSPFISVYRQPDHLLL
jgi:hypothetical protein